jgi:hypothetical protein
MWTLYGEAFRRLSISGRLHLVSSFRKRTLQKALDIEFVFYQQQAHEVMLVQLSIGLFRSRQNEQSVISWLFRSHVRWL